MVLKQVKLPIPKAELLVSVLGVLIKQLVTLNTKFNAMVRRIFCISITLFSILSAIRSNSDTDFDPGTLVLKEVFAKRTDTPPKIDGDLSDSVWDKAPVILEFFQTEPEDLA